MIDGVGVAAMLVPEAGTDLQEEDATFFEARGKFGEVFGEAGADLAGHESRDAGAGELKGDGGGGVAFPPGFALRFAPGYFAVHDETAVDDLEWVLCGWWWGRGCYGCVEFGDLVVVFVFGFLREGG